MCFNRWMANAGAGYGLASHACERCVLRFDMVFDRRTRGVVAESARSRRGVGTESSQGSLFFVGQNGGVATPPAESWQLFERCV